MKIAVISHTAHFRSTDGTIVGWGPTISELNHLAQDFDEIYHVAFLHPGIPPSSALPYASSNIKFIPLKPVGGSGFTEKLKVIASIPKILKIVKNTLKLVDVFQLRTPTGMGVFLIPYLTFFSNKNGWYKYAGNWNQANPPLGYRLQRWMLKNQQRKVTINGNWPKQPKHCITFENPCLTEEERVAGRTLTNSKDFKPPYTFCFVGRLEDEKGMQRIIDAFGNLSNFNKINQIHFIGDGDKMELYRKQCKELGLPVYFHGFMSRPEVFEIYKKSHFILLPSDSEGFPKVIAEAMNYGCIPIVSDISSIGQYVNEKNGFLVKPINSEQLLDAIKTAVSRTEDELNKMAMDCYLVSSKFTFKIYLKKIQEQILTF